MWNVCSRKVPTLPAQILFAFVGCVPFWGAFGCIFDRFWWLFGYLEVILTVWGYPCDPLWANLAKRCDFDTNSYSILERFLNFSGLFGYLFSALFLGCLFAPTGSAFRLKKYDFSKEGYQKSRNPQVAKKVQKGWFFVSFWSLLGSFLWLFGYFF